MSTAEGAATSGAAGSCAEAARAGAAYVSPFLGRLDDISQPGIELIRTIAAIFANYPDIRTQIIAASVRNSIHVTDCALAGADIATVPYKVIEQMTHHPLWKGYVSDVGGPTANFRQPACKKQLQHGACQKRQCLFPEPCPNLEIDHSDYVALLRKLRALPKVKRVFVRSGIRFDYLINDKDETFFRELVRYHVSGQLKVAPEHVSDGALRMMGKPQNSVYRRFAKRYKELNAEMHLDQYLVPYLMSSHPGSTLQDAIRLAEYLRELGYMPEQVQDFYPTPSTMSTCMYYTGLDPRTMEPVYIPKNPHEKAMQRALIQYKNPANRELVKEALITAGRTDLIGTDRKCLIRTGNGSDTKRKEAERGSKMKDRRNTQKKKTIRNIHKKKSR